MRAGMCCTFHTARIKKGEPEMNTWEINTQGKIRHFLRSKISSKIIMKARWLPEKSWFVVGLGNRPIQITGFVLH